MKREKKEEKTEAAAKIAALNVGGLQEQKRLNDGWKKAVTGERVEGCEQPQS